MADAAAADAAAAEDKDTAVYDFGGLTRRSGKLFFFLK